VVALNATNGKMIWFFDFEGKRQAQRAARHVKRTHRVKVVKNVHILVERRAVADLDEVVDDHRPARERRQPLPAEQR